MDEATPVPPTGAQPARLRTDVLLTFIGKASTLLLGLATAALIARRLGPSGQGIFAVAYSLTLMLVQLGSLGVTSANTYFAARSPGQIPRIIGNALWLAVVLGLVVGGVGVALKVIVPGVTADLGWTPLLVALAGIPGALAALFLQSVLLGEGRMVAYNAVDAGQSALTFIAILAGFVAADFRVAGTLALLGAGRYAATGVYLLLLARHSGVFHWPDPALARSMLSYGFRIYIAILSSFLVIRLDLLLVNSFLGSVEAGLYSVAATLADGMFVLPMVIGLNLFPRIARGDPIEASAAVFRSVAVLYGFVCLATVPVAGVGIRTFFGDDYADATGLYYWLLPGIFCLGLLTILSHHFAGRGYPVQAMAIWLGALALNIVLNLVFLPGGGAWVAALTSSITYATLLAFHIWLFAKETESYDALVPRPREVVQFVRVALSRG